ncbi:hypothetical protein OWR29_22555 [Actinoplanes sp. Pm04-4]|uniref:Uncharacterized protein n=1 Tax=Paractinoplanes pyxinae TaxID=2997416 RepID=A0ABT4B599_9ACTN|nr:hypothetical protein [Actinoplanes pyxinae]MCY1140788.1 hypothetical protein [Actinoplanes pyxinae]
MLIAGGGGGAGGTPWGMLTVEEMQVLIQNPDTDRHYELLTGWKRSADLLVEHQWQVKNYRDNLAAVWPPERNAASAAYISRLDELITNLNETYEAAISNHDAFAAATLSISLAQKEMEEIAREYQSNELALADYNAKQQSASAQPQPSPSPSGEQPPFAPGRQEELYQKAVTLLSGVSADLAQAQVRIQTPRPYAPKNRRDDPGSSEGGGYIAPPIPPITPDYAPSTSTSGTPIRPSATFPSSGNVPTPPPPQPPTPQPGLILGGANPPTTPPSPGLTSPLGTAPVGPPAPSQSPGLFAPTPTTFTPSRSTPLQPITPPSGRGLIGPRDGIVRPGGLLPGSSPALPPGGVIGATPGMGAARPGPSRTNAQRINPIGGVIGGADPSGRVGAANAAVPHPGVGAPIGQAQRGSTRRKQDEQLRWDPDDPWQTATGVDPVVLPPQVKRVDPGPAIGLS